jgi:hypothetical protein
VPPPPPSPLHRCLRFHAAAPGLPGFEEDFTTAPLDPSPGWADLLPGANSHPFLNQTSLAASTFTSTKQPRIWLTKTFSKQLGSRHGVYSSTTVDGNQRTLRSLGVRLLQDSVDPTTTDALHGLPPSCILYIIPPASSNVCVL